MCICNLIVSIVVGWCYFSWQNPSYHVPSSQQPRSKPHDFNIYNAMQAIISWLTPPASHQHEQVSSMSFDTFLFWLVWDTVWCRSHLLTHSLTHCLSLFSYLSLTGFHSLQKTYQSNNFEFKINCKFDWVNFIVLICFQQGF